LKEIHDHIRWEPLERILLEDSPVGKSPVGDKAYPPVMLLKALLLQKWFGIISDPELEN
jgi:transposase, IS5 family